jgi:hypothetical protein
MNIAFEFLQERQKKSSRGGAPSAKFGGASSRPQKFYGGNGQRRGSGPNGSRNAIPPKINTVIKTRFCRTSSRSKAQLLERIRYIDRHGRDDREDKNFFDRDRSDFTADHVFQRLSRYQGEEVSFHSFKVSPGDNDINLMSYTREIMDRLERDLGCELAWSGREHNDTDHRHVHVLIAGQVPEQLRNLYRSYREGDDVRIKLSELKRCREAGNEFIARERGMDPDLDRYAQIFLGLGGVYTDDKVVELLRDVRLLSYGSIKPEDKQRAYPLPDQSPEQFIADRWRLDAELSRIVARDLGGERNWGLDRIAREIRQRFYDDLKEKERAQAQDKSREKSQEKPQEKSREKSQEKLHEIAQQIFRGNAQDKPREKTQEILREKSRDPQQLKLSRMLGSQERWSGTTSRIQRQQRTMPTRVRKLRDDR